MIMESKNNTFVIVAKEGITPEIYLAKLVRKSRHINQLTIFSQIGCQWMADRVINDFLDIGGRVKEYERRARKEVGNEGKKYEQDVYEYSLKRDVHNLLEEEY